MHDFSGDALNLKLNGAGLSFQSFLGEQNYIDRAQGGLFGKLAPCQWDFHPDSYAYKLIMDKQTHRQILVWCLQAHERQSS